MAVEAMEEHEVYEAETVGPLRDALQTAVLELDEAKRRIDSVLAAIAEVGGRQ